MERKLSFKKLSIEKLKALCSFQRRYRFIRNEINSINTSIIFYKDILMSMINNLTKLNIIKVFQNTKSHNIVILDEMKEIKLLLDEIRSLNIYPKLNLKNKY